MVSSDGPVMPTMPLPLQRPLPLMVEIWPDRQRFFRGRLELPEGLPQCRPRILGPHQPAALQRRHQPLADLVDVAAADPLERRADQEAVAADLLDRLAHPLGDRIRGPDQVEAVVKTFGRELPQGFAAAPLLELIQRARLTICGEPR